RPCHATAAPISALLRLWAGSVQRAAGCSAARGGGAGSGALDGCGSHRRWLAGREGRQTLERGRHVIPDTPPTQVRFEAGPPPLLQSALLFFGLSFNRTRLVLSLFRYDV